MKTGAKGLQGDKIFFWNTARTSGLDWGNPQAPVGAGRDLRRKIRCKINLPLQSLHP